MTTITISRQLGSWGCQVAKEGAEKLGYRLVWRELINQAAIRAGAPEMALAAIDELGLLNIRVSSRAHQAYRVALEQVILEQAMMGNVVIVGRAGQAILGPRPDVLHIRVIAPLELRVERQASAAGVSLESARAQVETSDHNRSRFLRHTYQINWDNPYLYHLVINTGLMSAPIAAQLIADTVGQIAQTKPSPNE